MDPVGKELKRLIAAHRPAARIDTLAQQAADGILPLNTQAALRQAGILSPNFWLTNLLHY
jgi:hypothetical protein